MAKIQITGGGFQDAEGNPLALGYLIFELSQDCEVASTGQVCSGIVANVPLDASGNISGTVNIWPNDQLIPTNNYYTVTGYTQAGQRAWGPNVQQVLGAGPFSLNSWVPNAVTNWNPSSVQVLLQTNEVSNATQTLLDLHAGPNMVLADNGSGRVTFTAAQQIALKTNSVNNGSQSILNLENGLNIAVTDDGSGGIKIATPPLLSPFKQLLWRNFGANTGFTLGATMFSASTGTDTNTTEATDSNHLGGLQVAVGSAAGSSYFTFTNGNYCLGKGNLHVGGVYRIVDAASLSALNARHVPIGAYTGEGALFTVGGGMESANPACGFYSDSGHWAAYIINAGVITATTTGVSLDNLPHTFEIYSNDGLVPRTLTFFIDGNLVVTLNSSLPTNVGGTFFTRVVAGTSNTSDAVAYTGEIFQMYAESSFY